MQHKIWLVTTVHHPTVYLCEFYSQLSAGHVSCVRGEDGVSDTQHKTHAPLSQVVPGVWGILLSGFGEILLSVLGEVLMSILVEDLF